MKHGKRAAAAFCRAVGLFSLLAVVGLYMLLGLPRLLGRQSFVITSASMAPQLPVGSLVFVREVQDPGSLLPGQIVAFRSGMDGPGGEDTITHRIVSNDPARRELVTKGDANHAQDPRTVSYERLLGVVEGCIPLWGEAALVLGSTAGKMGALSLLVCAAALYAAGARLDEGKKKSGAKAAVP